MGSMRAVGWSVRGETPRLSPLGTSSRYAGAEFARNSAENGRTEYGTSRTLSRRNSKNLVESPPYHLVISLRSPGQEFSRKVENLRKRSPRSMCVLLTPVPQVGAPTPSVRPLLCQPLNYFFSLPALLATAPAKMPESIGVLTSNCSRRPAIISSLSLSLPLHVRE